MPVRLRLRRLGRKGTPYYHIVAADARSTRSGKYLEQIGVYNPTTVPAHIEVSHELALKWLQNGAQPTDTVRSILRYTGVNLKYALMKQGKDEETIEKMFTKWWGEKQDRIQSKKDRIGSEKLTVQQELQKQEVKIRAERAEAIRSKNTPPAPEAPAKEEVAVEEAAPLTASEIAKSMSGDTKVAEAPVVEAPVAEAPATEEKTEE